MNDTKKIGSHIIHIGKVVEGNIDNPRVVAKIDSKRRKEVASNHTTTHLLHWALRKFIGKHVAQAGSLVAPGRLRFDVTHFEKISPTQLEDIAEAVNEKIRTNAPITTSQSSYDEAKKRGAMAIFEEKYGDIVRVVQIGDFSLELCGGTHLQHTGEAGLFTFLSESSAAAGIRRLEAVTGKSSEQIVRDERRLTNELRSLLNVSNEKDLTGKVHELLDSRKYLERELQKCVSSFHSSKWST